MVDLSFLEKFTNGDTVKMKRYIQIYLRTAPTTLKEMQKNIADRDWEQLRINAHSLKPLADYMGIQSLKEVLVKIEQRVYDKKYALLHELVRRAIDIHTESIPVLEDNI